MSTQGPPPRSSDGHSDSQDNDDGAPEGLLLSKYEMNVLVSADFLKNLEELAWKCHLDRRQFNQLIFAKGIQALAHEVEIVGDPDHKANLNMLGRLGAKARGKSGSRNSEA